MRLIERYLPQVRLRAFAQRLIAQYPNPPRPVRPKDVVWVYGPFLAFTAVLLTVFSVSVILERPSSGVWIPVVVIPAWATLFLVLLSRALGAVKNGVFAKAEVISAGVLSSRMRATIRSQEIDVFYGRVYQQGERLDVMIDPASNRVLVVLGTS